MIIVGVLNTLEKPTRNFMDVLPGDMEEKGLAYPITSSHVSGD